MQKSIYTFEYKKLIELLYRLRVNQGLKQIDLADKLGVHQSYVSKIENGEKRLDLIELRNMCRCLNISLIDFVKELEKQIDET
ncbi:MAG: helix-turn-helix transcriptional regulator [bacterium]|nr:helix-turn-helix transcriptional regulator [bacterium]